MHADACSCLFCFPKHNCYESPSDNSGLGCAQLWQIDHLNLPVYFPLSHWLFAVDGYASLYHLKNVVSWSSPAIGIGGCFSTDLVCTWAMSFSLSPLCRHLVPAGPEGCRICEVVGPGIWFAQQKNMQSVQGCCLHPNMHRACVSDPLLGRKANTRSQCSPVFCWHETSRRSNPRTAAQG